MLARTATFVLLALLFFGTTTAQAEQDAWIGTWKLSAAKSKYDPASTAANSVTTTLKREAAGAGYKTTIDGATHTESTNTTLDGKDYPLTGSPDFNTASYKRLDADTLVTVNKKDGAVVRMGRIVLAKDGKSWTVDLVGYTAKGAAYHNVLVFERQ